MTTGVDILIEASGGVRRLSAMIKEATGEHCPPSTIQYWQETGHVPHKRIGSVRRTIAHFGLPVQVGEQFQAVETGT